MSEADELRSFVGTEREGWWVWVASDARTRPVVTMVAGDRSERTARCPWDALPDGDRDGAVVAADFLAAYRAVVPADRHAAAGKDAGLTAHVERFWLAVRPRCARFVRRTLSFSKCAENHTGSLGYFIRHYNASLRRGHYRLGVAGQVRGPGPEDGPEAVDGPIRRRLPDERPERLDRLQLRGTRRQDVRRSANPAGPSAVHRRSTARAVMTDTPTAVAAGSGGRRPGAGSR